MIWTIRFQTLLHCHHFCSAPWTLHKPSVSFLFKQPKASISPVEVQQTFSEYVAAHNDFQFLYTDGSKDDHRTSYAVVSHGLPDITTRLPDDTSIYIAELQAIQAALKVIKNNNISRACICSDSKSAIQSLINPSFTNTFISTYLTSIIHWWRTEHSLHFSGYRVTVT